MDLRIMPLICFLVFFFSTPSPIYAIDRTAFIDTELLLSDSLTHQLSTWKEQDSLIPWLSALKKESQFLRSEDNTLGAIHLLSKAINDIWRKTKSDEEHKLLGWIYVNRAYLYDQKYGDFLAAKHDYLNALNCFEKANYNDFLVARYLLQPLGNIYTRLGENEQAIVVLEEFQRKCSANNQKEALINSYNDLGRAYMNKNEYQNAIALFDEGCNISPIDDFNLGLLKSSKAEAQLYLESYENGIKTAKSSLNNLAYALKNMETSDFRFEACARYIIGAEAVLAELYLKQGQFNPSRLAFENALKKTDHFYKKKHRRKAKILIGLGKCYEQFNRYEKSILYYQKALIGAIYNFDDLTISHNPTHKMLYADVVIGEALIGKARVAKQLFNQTNDQTLLELSLATYLTYFDWVKKLQAEQLNIFSKLNLAKEIHTVGEETLSVIFTLKQLTKDNSFAKIAFQIMEYTKGIVLSESNRVALLNTNLTIKKELTQLNHLKMQRSVFKIDLNTAKKEKNASEITRLKISIEALDRQIAIKDFKLKERFPFYLKNQVHQSDSINFEQLTTYLSNNKLHLFSYFEGADKLYTVSCYNGDFKLTQVDGETYKKAITEFTQQLNDPANSATKKYATSAQQLYRILIGSHAKETGKNWLILPDGNLNLIPFEALVMENDSHAYSFKSLNYLVREKVIHYAPSIKFILQDRIMKDYPNDYLGIAPVFNETKDLPHLPYSEEEVKYAHNLFSGDLLLHKDASKDEFLNHASHYQLIHLSTHAGVGSKSDNDSWIAFQNEQNIEKLITPELLQLNLSTRLVILNGCETGLGEIYKGEGVLSMARGFMQAGAESIITNLWQVNHSSNAQLMHSFYNSLQENYSPSNSLTAAKLDYLTNDEVDDLGAHPYYWAASVLIGTNNKLTLNPKSNFLPFVFGALLLVLVLVILMYVRGRLLN